MTLPNDLGTALAITGRLIAEDMHFDKTTETLTVEKLYRTAEHELAYGVVAAVGQTRERRAYLIKEQAGVCAAHNGRLTLEMPTENLLELLALALTAEDGAAPEASRERMLHKFAANH